MVRIAKIDGECSCAGRAKQRRIISVPSVALIRSGKDPGGVSATRCNPRVLPALRCDASSARREGGFTRQGRRHVAADVLPCHSVGCAKIGECSIAALVQIVGNATGIAGPLVQYSKTFNVVFSSFEVFS